MPRPLPRRAPLPTSLSPRQSGEEPAPRRQPAASEITTRLRAAGLETGAVARDDGRAGAGGGPAEVGEISSKQLKAMLDTAFANNEDFAAVYEREKPQQISDTGAIEAMIDEVIAANPKQVEQFRGGKKTVAAFFVGQVMQLSKGQANPALLNELVVKKLDAA